LPLLVFVVVMTMMMTTTVMKTTMIMLICLRDYTRPKRIIVWNYDSTLVLTV